LFLWDEIDASDARALVAFNSEIKIAGPKGERSMAVEDFFGPLGNVLKRGEMVTEVEVPRINGPMRQTFLKFTLRKPVDFAVVSVASTITLKEGVCEDARIVLGAVAPAPVRATKAEEVIKGRPIDQKMRLMKVPRRARPPSQSKCPSGTNRSFSWKRKKGKTFWKL
jgi:CO/xanthine dehydrogenase FAD-binding subunit